jgi:AcrR family transcriptional regulator
MTEWSAIDKEIRMPRSKVLSEQMRAKSREKILTAARQIFAGEGYFKVKAADIARAGGMSQGNLYWYFDSKEDVLKTILAQGFTELHSLTAEIAALPGNGLEKIEALIERTWELYQRQSEFTTILGSLLAHGGAPFIKELGFDMLAIGTGFHLNLSAVFEQARAEGILPDVEPNMLVVLYYAFLNGLVITYPDLWPTMDISFVREAVLRLLGYREPAEKEAR